MATEDAPTIVLIEWLDAHAEADGWLGPDDIEEEGTLVQTVGILIPEGKDGHVVVAQSIARDGDFYHVFCVPVGMVRSVRVISRGGASPLFPCVPPSGQVGSPSPLP